MAESYEPILEQEHPIPQQISAYQFKLVGDMTLKQFFQVAGGVLVALFFYASTIPVFIKWPLIVISFLFGIALAFFPIEDRPLSTWIAAFIRSIYSPTIYVWKKGYQKPNYFQAEVGLPLQAAAVQAPETVLYEDAAQKSPSAELDKKEKEFLNKVQEQFKEPVTPVLNVALKEPGPLKTVPKKEEVAVKVPEKEALKVEKTETATEDTVPTEAPAQPDYTFHVSPVMGTQTNQSSQTARFSAEAGAPITPTTPNIIVGQVLDSEGKIIENAILEIRDTDGRPVRAFKTNKLGHFMIVTPLATGKYQITTEKEGLEFSPISIEATGKIIPPVAIWAKKPGGQEPQHTNPDAGRLYGELFEKPKITISE
jgi:hypothetical protein